MLYFLAYHNLMNDLDCKYCCFVETVSIICHVGHGMMEVNAVLFDCFNDSNC